MHSWCFFTHRTITVSTAHFATLGGQWNQECGPIFLFRFIFHFFYYLCFFNGLGETSSVALHSWWRMIYWIEDMRLAHCVRESKKLIFHSWVDLYIYIYFFFTCSVNLVISGFECHIAFISQEYTQLTVEIREVFFPSGSQIDSDEYYVVIIIVI